MNSTPPDPTQISKLAEALARRCGERVKHEIARPGTYQVMEKSGKSDLVTEVDIWVEQEITAAVTSAFPDHLVIGEETSGKLESETGKTLKELIARGVSWVIDPIDGTTNFIRGIPHVAISIAVLVDGARYAGFAFDPLRNEFFSAISGRGAHLNGEPIRGSRRTNLSEALIATGVPHNRYTSWPKNRPIYEKLFAAVSDVRRAGAAVLDQCWVACGRLDGYFEYSLKPWDVAAASIIVEEAGGKAGCAADRNTSEFSIFGSCFVFASPGIFQSMLEVVYQGSHS